MLANTREELNNTILQKLCEKMNPEKLRENDLGMMKGASSYFAIISAYDSFSPLLQRNRANSFRTSPEAI